MKRRQILKQDAICTRRCGCIAAWPGSAGYLAEISEEDLSDGFLADIMNEKRSRIKSDSQSSQSHADNVSEYFWWEPGSSSRNIQHWYGNVLYLGLIYPTIISACRRHWYWDLFQFHFWSVTWTDRLVTQTLRWCTVMWCCMPDIFLPIILDKNLKTDLIWKIVVVWSCLLTTARGLWPGHSAPLQSKR